MSARGPLKLVLMDHLHNYVILLEEDVTQDGAIAMTQACIGRRLSCISNDSKRMLHHLLCKTRDIINGERPDRDYITYMGSTMFKIHNVTVEERLVSSTELVVSGVYNDETPFEAWTIIREGRSLPDCESNIPFVSKEKECEWAARLHVAISESKFNSILEDEMARICG